MKKLAGFCGAWRHRSPLGLPRGGGSAGSRLGWDGKRAGRKTKSAFLTWSPIPAWNLAARDGAAEESCLSAYPHHHHDFHVAAFRRSELDPRRPCKGNPKTMARSEPIMALSRRSKTQLIVRTQYLLVLRFTRYDLNRLRACRWLGYVGERPSRRCDRLAGAAWESVPQQCGFHPDRENPR
jgi:hypothetical protein